MVYWRLYGEDILIFAYGLWRRKWGGHVDFCFKPNNNKHIEETGEDILIFAYGIWKVIWGGHFHFCVWSMEAYMGRTCSVLFQNEQ